MKWYMFVVEFVLVYICVVLYIGDWINHDTELRSVDTNKLLMTLCKFLED